MLCGAVGVLLYLGAYFLLQAGYLQGSSYVYVGLNLVGAALVLVSLIQAFNLFSAIIQISWIAISLFGIVRILLRNRALRFTPEEEALIRAKLAKMRRINARTLLNQGHWMDVTGEPVTLIEEGTPSPALFYLAKGSARIVSDGFEVAQASPGSFLGEITVLSGEAATGTVTAEPGARLFRIARASLKRLVDTDPELRAELDTAVNADTRSKLEALNQRIIGQSLEQAQASR